MDIPKDKNYPEDSAQCNGCGGGGCEACGYKGWLIPRDHPKGRKCENTLCGRPLHPANKALYCDNKCAMEDG